MALNFDVICVGNAKIDTFLSLHEANSHLRLIEETYELCMKFGEKIAVDRADILVGGNAANVSVGTSRLGLKSALVAEIGGDEFAQKIINALKTENVESSNVLVKEGQQSSFSTILNYKGDRTIFTEHVVRSHNFNFENISAKLVYLTSLGEQWQEAYNKTVEFAKVSQSLLAFNPGTLQINNGRDSIEYILKATDILFVNKEEAEQLLGFPRRQNVEDLVKELQTIGPKIAVITDGINGSIAIDDKGTICRKSIVGVPVVERTGAGDAYSAGFISALLYNKSLDTAMEWGTRNSASVIGKVGAQPGLLYKNDLI
jgi:sugar/nucleoside kinase (ribokinase family)